MDVLRWTTLALVLALTGPGPARAAEGRQAAGGQPAVTRRRAVVVGANRAAPGRPALRWSHADARRMAAVLTEVGGFAAEDVELLLDPAPDRVLSVLDHALARAEREDGASMLVFYYSGHADGEALYPGGRPLPLADLRRRIDDERATVRIGILDACRGGAWTRTKGLHADAPFEVPIAAALQSEGAVLIAASSGLEDAHETLSLRGSFFTHHLVAGLRGAADASGDGAVSVTEAFAYARGLTVRDSIVEVGTAQHPSFDLRLRGRGDVTLTRVDGARGVLVLAQRRGPLQLVEAGSGAVIADLPEGPRETRLAVPPGRYLVARRTAAGAGALREVTVREGRAVRVSEAELTPVRPGLVSKAAGPPALTLPAGGFGARAAVGYRAGAGLDGFVGVGLGITDHVQVELVSPSVAVRFGAAGGRELLIWGGLERWALTGGEFGYLAGAKGAYRHGLGASVALDTAAWVMNLGSTRATAPVWYAGLAAGLTWRPGDRVSLHPGVSVESDRSGGPVVRADGLRYSVGAVMDVGPRLMPLLQVRLTRRVRFDGYVTLTWPGTGGLGLPDTRLLAGLTVFLF